jgi:hypothetical protein
MLEDNSDEKIINEKLKNFSALLNDIESLNDKKKQLWREIYENAITDRQHSYVMFKKLVKITQDQSTEHAVHGRTITTYIERMSKANDQLIKLAELIARAQSKEQEINPDEIFDRIKER